jgi:hypothetical protein
MCQYVNVPMCQLAALLSIGILTNWYIDHIGILYHWHIGTLFHWHIGTLFHWHIIPPLLSISEGKFDISQPEYGL